MLLNVCILIYVIKIYFGLYIFLYFVRKFVEMNIDIFVINYLIILLRGRDSDINSFYKYSIILRF